MQALNKQPSLHALGSGSGSTVPSKHTSSGRRSGARLCASSTTCMGNWQSQSLIRARYVYANHI